MNEFFFLLCAVCGDPWSDTVEAGYKSLTADSGSSLSRMMNENIGDFFSPPAHLTTAIFQLLRLLDDRMMIDLMTWKFRDDISNGSGVIALTDRQTNKSQNVQKIQKAPV